MNSEEFKIKSEIIRKHFKDTRKIKCLTPDHIRELDECVHKGGDIFTTETGEFIDLEYQFVDFDEVELAKYVEFAENLYEKHHKHVAIYIICPKNLNVTVREFTIKSEADFTIKLYCIQEDPCGIILNEIKNKLRNNETLTGRDMHNLEMLPLMCDKKDKNFFRVESFKILNMLTD